MTLCYRQHTLTFPRPPLVMGIVNINDDSFSGDGTLDVDQALAQAASMVREGADIIDVGAESARTNRAAIPAEEEIRRLLPFLERFEGVCAQEPEASQAYGQVWPPLLSINTWRPEVAAAVLPVAGDILNDMGALPDPRNAETCALTGAALLIMHSVGAPKVAHTAEQYADVVTSVEMFFEEKITMAEAAGVTRDQIILDPGIDFAKQTKDNLRIYAQLERLHQFARPLLLPVSRKTVIGDVLGISKAAERDAGTVGCLTAGFLRGAQIFRVHNVRAAVSALRVLDAVRGS